MAALTSSGRTALAISVKVDPSTWPGAMARPGGIQTRPTPTFSNNQLSLAYGNVSSVVVKSLDQTTTITDVTDYTVNATTGVIDRVTTGSIAAGAQVSVEYFVTRPTEATSSAALANEVGRRIATQVDFCTPNNASGSIVVPTGRFDVSSTPTNNLYMRFVYDFADAAGEVIREQAVYIDTVTDASLPSGQTYFDATDVTTQGTLLVISTAQRSHDSARLARRSSSSSRSEELTHGIAGLLQPFSAISELRRAAVPCEQRPSVC